MNTKAAPIYTRDTTVTSVLVSDQASEWTQVEFGIQDPKGRSVGAAYKVGRVEYVAAQAVEGCQAWDLKDAQGRRIQSVVPGVYFFYVTCATRAGGGFGASQPRQHFTAEAARDAALAKYLKQAEARQRKQFGTSQAVGA